MVHIFSCQHMFSVGVETNLFIGNAASVLTCNHQPYDSAVHILQCVLSPHTAAPVSSKAWVRIPRLPPCNILCSYITKGVVVGCCLQGDAERHAIHFSFFFLKPY